MSFDSFVQAFVNGLSLGMIYAAVALGLTFVFSIMAVINFAHASLYMLGAYVMYYFFASWQLPYGVAFAAAVVITGAVGFVIERGFYRPTRSVMLSSMVIAIAINTVMEHGALLGFGFDPKKVPSVFTGVVNIFGNTFSIERLATGLIGLALVLAFVFFVRYTRMGRAMRAVSQDYDAACLSGANVSLTYSLAMVIGSALAGAAGALMSSMFSVDPFMGLPYLFKAFVIIIVGGLGSIPGSILAGLLIGEIDSIFTTWLGNIAHMFGFILVIIILVFRPRGLMGTGRV